VSTIKEGPSDWVRRTDDAIANRERRDWEEAHLPPLGDGEPQHHASESVSPSIIRSIIAEAKQVPVLAETFCGQCAHYWPGPDCRNCGRTTLGFCPWTGQARFDTQRGCDMWRKSGQTERDDK